MQDKNQKLQEKIKKMLADAIKSGEADLSDLYPVFFMLSFCETYEEQLIALSTFSYEIPVLNKIVISEKAMAMTE
ncbi:MAG: hypothetical protein WCT46_01010 [Candidatus Gracilibacteria bacterium]|jgi:hypothetical protein